MSPENENGGEVKLCENCALRDHMYEVTTEGRKYFPPTCGRGWRDYKTFELPEERETGECGVDGKFFIPLTRHNPTPREGEESE